MLLILQSAMLKVHVVVLILQACNVKRSAVQRLLFIISCSFHKYQVFNVIVEELATDYHTSIIGAQLNIKHIFPAEPIRALLYYPATRQCLTYCCIVPLYA